MFGCMGKILFVDMAKGSFSEFQLQEEVYGEPLLKDGPLKGKSFPLVEKVGLHWKAMGWNERSGMPEAQTIERLGLGELAAKHFPKGIEQV